MELSIQKWGNSAAVRLSTEFLSLLNVKLGDKLTVDIRPEVRCSSPSGTSMRWKSS